MSHDSHGGHGTPGEQAYFTPVEWEQLRAEDRSGAKAISGLMVGIFTTGLILYSIVAWTL